ncbi:hypothetical protein [Spirillospora sp. NPDC029432]|uniref:hypothetical protein n=1 Tax=Spirillospora sp. NPDC029432 TaxID=3154599 RepID=UPI003453D03F
MTDDGSTTENAEPSARPPRPALVAPEQGLDGSPREPAAPEAPEALDEAAPPERSRRRLLQAGIAAGAVLLVGALLLGLAVRSGSEAAPQYASLPDVCSTLSKNTLQRHAPRAGAGEPSGGKAAAGERQGSCEWKEPLTGEPDGALSSHRFAVGMRLMLDGGGKAGTALAEGAYQTEWDAARSGSGRSTQSPVRLEFDRPFPLKGFGDQAFARPIQSSGASVGTSKVVVTARVRNVLVTVEYAHTVQPAEKKGDEAGPIDTPTARAGAEVAARDVLAALKACARCAG